MKNQSVFTSEHVKWIAFSLAIFTSVAYLLIRFNILGIGDLVASEQPVGIVYASAGCYLVGGFLILLKRKWLWVIGAIINALVVFFFFSMYKGQVSVLLSAGGLTTKIAQILLEMSLVYLIFATKPIPSSTK